jgi:hypothetical protein
MPDGSPVADLSIFRSTDGVMQGVAWCDVLVLFATGATTLANQRETEPWLIRVSERYPSGIALLPCVAAQSPVPSGPARDQIGMMYARNAQRLRAVAMVVEGQGFRGAAMRAAFTGVNIIQRRPYMTQVFDDFQAALAWAVGRLPPLPERGTVADHVSLILAARRPPLR